MRFIQERLKELRKELGLSQEEFGRRLGLTRGAITNIEFGKTEPKPLFVDLVCKVYNVRRQWLIDGDLPMFEATNRDEAIGKFVSEVLRGESDNFKRRFISALARLDETAWAEIEKFAAMLADEEKKE